MNEYTYEEIAVLLLDALILQARKEGLTHAQALAAVVAALDENK